MSTQIQIRALAVAKTYGDATVVDLREFVAGAGERLGVVGENGSGKSTLMRILAGEEAPDLGTVSVQGTIGYLPQQPRCAAPATMAQFLDAELADLREVEDRLGAAAGQLTRDDSPAVLAQYERALAQAEARDVWAAPARLETALAGLGVAHLERHRRLSELSGGQVSRIALAALLVRRPEILLLDEPTNHLDDAALDYLQGVLTGWPGVVVAVSHDRVFLDAVCTTILDLDPARDGATSYGGRYTEYLTAKAAQRQRWEQAHQAWRDELNRLGSLAHGGAHRIAPNRGPTDNDKFITKFKGARVDATVRRRVRDAEQRLRALQDARVPKPPPTLHFSPPDRPAPSVSSAISVRDAAVPGRVEIGALDITHDTRLLITGPNGAGKSTVLAVLAGRLRPATGTVVIRAGTRAGLLAQQTSWEQPDQTALAIFAAGRPGDAEQQLAALLDLGLLHPRELRTPVSRLSFGQQRRLALACLLADRPDVLLLDEPTDHLSLCLVEELEEAVRAWPGPVVVASHDRWLRRRWTGQHATVQAGQLRPAAVQY
jgi:macrolide transport system ATP-binding/permease protein